VVFRAFISVDVGEVLDTTGLRSSLEMANARMKLVEPRNLHMTLKFLGDIDEAIVDDIAGIMANAVEGTRPFTVSFKGVGAFPKPHYIRVIWIGIERDGADQLAGISKKIDTDLNSALRMKKEKKGFSPHLTVARVKSVRDKKGLADILESYRDTEFGQLEVTSIRLKKSVLSGQGPTYSTVKEIRIGD
jgi:2'-5' RNA ligase